MVIQAYLKCNNCNRQITFTMNLPQELFLGETLINLLTKCSPAIYSFGERCTKEGKVDCFVLFCKSCAPQFIETQSNQG